jgi:hypothetical protein
MVVRVLEPHVSRSYDIPTTDAAEGGEQRTVFAICQLLILR